jgi:lipid-binding SYLF domain-containing protein
MFFLSMILVISTQAITFAKESPDELRAKLDKMSVEVLERMYAKYPDAKRSVANSYAYCTISNSSVNWGFLGSDRGRGLAYNQNLDKKIYVKMSELKLGLSVGAKEYDLLFIIQNKEATDLFRAV